MRSQRRLMVCSVFACGLLATSCGSSGSGSPTATTSGAPPTVTSPPVTSPSATAASPTPTASPVWQALPVAPIAGRVAAGAVWTGTEMIVWGGVIRGEGTAEAVGDGAAFDPTKGSWRTIAPAPPGLVGNAGRASAWTGDAAVFWAGNSPDGPAAGGVYDPTADSWRRLAKGPLGVRESEVSVWTGTELVIIGGTAGDGFASPVAAAVNPSANSWRLLPALNDLKAFIPAGAVWDGTGRAFIAGTKYLCPEQGSGCTDSKVVFLAYSPSADTADDIDLSNAPVPDDLLASLTPVGWTGSEVAMLTMQGRSRGLVFYDPSSGRWRTGAAPTCVEKRGVFGQTAWIDGGEVLPCGADRLQIYDVGTDRWTVIDAGPSPFASREDSQIVWTGSELIVWSGVADQKFNPTPNTGSAIGL